MTCERPEHLLKDVPVVLTLQECYVCLGKANNDSPELEHQFPEERLPVCQRGILPPPKQCPPRYKGCLTQYSGELVQRSCGELNLTICQQANLVEYCYCEGNLCNSKEKELPSTTTDQTSDDEDDERGSGQGPAFDSGGSNQKTAKPTRPSTYIGNKLGEAENVTGGATVAYLNLSASLSTLFIIALRQKI